MQQSREAGDAERSCVDVPVWACISGFHGIIQGRHLKMTDAQTVLLEQTPPIAADAGFPSFCLICRPSAARGRRVEADEVDNLEVVNDYGLVSLARESAKVARSTLGDVQTKCVSVRPLPFFGSDVLFRGQNQISWQVALGFLFLVYLAKAVRPPAICCVRILLLTPRGDAAFRTWIPAAPFNIRCDYRGNAFYANSYYFAPGLSQKLQVNFEVPLSSQQCDSLWSRYNDQRRAFWIAACDPWS